MVNIRFSIIYCWLVPYPNPNPVFEIALYLVLQGRIIPQQTRERYAIAVEQFKCSGRIKAVDAEFEVICHR